MKGEVECGECPEGGEVHLNSRVELEIVQTNTENIREIEREKSSEKLVTGGLGGASCPQGGDIPHDPWKGGTQGGG